MFQTSSCDRKLPTHSKCHSEFWADFPFPFPFSPLSNFFSSKTIQNLLPKLSSSIVVLMTSFPSLTHPCLMVKICLHFLCTASVPASTAFSPYILLLLASCYTTLLLMSQCWSTHSSVLRTKRVFSFLYTRLSQFSSKPTSCIYSLL